jgi:hypothetical protein
MPHAPNGIIADIRFGDVVQHKGNGCLRNPCMAGNIPTGHSRFVHALVHPLSINQEPSSHGIPYTQINLFQSATLWKEKHSRAYSFFVQGQQRLARKPYSQ